MCVCVLVDLIYLMTSTDFNLVGVTVFIIETVVMMRECWLSINILYDWLILIKHTGRHVPTPDGFVEFPHKSRSLIFCEIC